MTITKSNGNKTYAVKMPFSPAWRAKPMILRVNPNNVVGTGFSLRATYVENRWTYNFEVDWGDGSPVERYDGNSIKDNTFLYHSFPTSSTEYTITINGRIDNVYLGNSGPTLKIDQWGNLGSKVYVSSFTKLISTVDPMFRDFGKVESFEPSFESSRPNPVTHSPPANIKFEKNFFEYAKNLDHIYMQCYDVNVLSSASFANNPKLDFFYCESPQSEIIPAGLFANNPLLTSVQLHRMSYLPDIPDDFLVNNPNVTNLSFSRIGELTPSGTLVKSNSFRGCGNVTNLSSMFSRGFIQCEGTVFRHFTKVTNCSSMFENCRFSNNLMPVGIFDKMTKLTNVSYAFSNSSSLTGTIPASIFDNNLLLDDLRNCFNGCSGLTGNAPALWTKFPTARGTGCFRGCTGLANYDSIPAAWK